MYNLNNSTVAAQTLQNAFVTIGNAGASETPTSGQLSALLTEFSTDPAGIDYKISGVYQSPVVMAGLFNLGGFVANPTPQGNAQLTTLPRNTVHDYLGELIVMVIASGANALSLAVLQAIQSTIATTATDPILTANVLAYIPAIKAGGYDPTAFITAVITGADPSWSSTVFISPRTNTVFPGEALFITPADVTAALAS